MIQRQYIMVGKKVQERALRGGKEYVRSAQKNALVFLDFSRAD